MTATPRLLIAVLLTTLVGCAEAPRARVRPVEMGPVDTGAGSLEAARRQLAGTWILASYTVHDAAGAAVSVPAAAKLTYDEYGNLTIQGTVEGGDERARQSGAFLNYKGRAVIDAAKQQLRLLDLEGTGNVPSSVNVSAAREYRIDGNRLDITAKDASGRVLAVASWTRAGS